MPCELVGQPLRKNIGTIHRQIEAVNFLFGIAVKKRLNGYADVDWFRFE